MVHLTARWVATLTLHCSLKWQQVLDSFLSEKRYLLATVDNIARTNSNGIEHFRTDEGSDWKSAEVAEVAQDRGIHHQHALVDAHGQIGKVERRFRYYQECADAILRQASACNVVNSRQ